MSDNLAALHNLVSQLQPGWQISLPDDIGQDLGMVAEAQLLRPYDDPMIVPGAMRCIGQHPFTGYNDPAVALWEAELDRLTASGQLDRPWSACPLWRLPGTLVDEDSPEPTWLLILCDDPAKVPALEREAGRSQAEAVNFYLEETCWSQDVPQFVGGRGSPEQRRAALAAAYRADKPECPY